MEKCLAFVLGGGGARGALHVGAMRALFENGYKPDLIVGTSIGAANAATLGWLGVNMDGLSALEQAYQKVAEAQLMDSPGRLVWHALSGRLYKTSNLARDFLIAAGITPDLHFDQIKDVRLGLIGAEMISGQPVIFGLDPGQSVLEGVLASCAVPPWFAPIENDDQLIVDGGALSMLPIEPALNMGATEIIALHLSGSPNHFTSIHRLDQLEKSISAFTQHEIYLEIALAKARGVPVHFISLRNDTPTESWEFDKYSQMIRNGYEITCREIAGWLKDEQADSPNFAPIAESQPISTGKTS